MKKIVRLTEQDLVKLVKRVINEATEGNGLSPNLQFFWKEAGLDSFVEENAHDTDMIDNAIGVISRGERRYEELTRDERDEIIREIRRRVKQHDDKKVEFEKYFAEKNKNISQGKKFISKKTPNGITLRWDIYDDQYVIYFPENELDEQILLLGNSSKDLELGEEIFSFIDNMEQRGISSNKLYKYAEMMRNKQQ